jgi:hypothetical protein
MSKKTLLNENTIRRFMKLASIAPLTENFVEKNKEELEEGPMGVYDRDEEEMGGPPVGEEPPPELDMVPPEEGEDELEGELPSGDGMSQAELEDKVEELAAMFLDNVEELFGVSGEVSTSEEEPLGDLEGPGDEVEEPLDMGPEMGMEDEEELEEGSGDRNDPRNERGNQRQKEGSAGNPGEYLEEKEELEEDVYKNLVNNITSKVASRLAEVKKLNEEKESSSKQIEHISDKIVERIFSFSKDK